MSNTLATRKQSAAIRARMQQIRSEMPYNVDDARRQVRQWTDWRYQFRKHPIAMMTTVAVAGYLLVPRARGKREVIVRTVDGETIAQPKAVKRGALSGVVAAAASLAIRTGTSILVEQLVGGLIDRRPASQSTEPQFVAVNDGKSFPQTAEEIG